MKYKLLLTAVCVCIALTSNLRAFDTGKNPVKAMVLSAVIPGGGQFYNESYYKGTAILALEGFFIGSLIYNNHQANRYFDKAESSEGDAYIRNLQQYNKYFERRQNDVWWLGSIVFLSVVDAFVDAGLFNFEYEKDSVHLLFEDKMIGIGIRW